MAQSSKKEDDELTRRAWKMLLKANPHREKLEKARSINPQAVVSISV